jgi:hypothetical protein
VLLCGRPGWQQRIESRRLHIVDDLIAFVLSVGGSPCPVSSLQHVVPIEIRVKDNVKRLIANLILSPLCRYVDRL